MEIFPIREWVCLFLAVKARVSSSLNPAVCPALAAEAADKNLRGCTLVQNPVVNGRLQPSHFRCVRDMGLLGDCSRAEV